MSKAKRGGKPERSEEGNGSDDAAASARDAKALQPQNPRWFRKKGLNRSAARRNDDAADLDRRALGQGQPGISGLAVKSAKPERARHIHTIRTAINMTISLTPLRHQHPHQPTAAGEKRERHRS